MDDRGLLKMKEDGIINITKWWWQGGGDDMIQHGHNDKLQSKNNSDEVKGAVSKRIIKASVLIETPWGALWLTE